MTTNKFFSLIVIALALLCCLVSCTDPADASTPDTSKTGDNSSVVSKDEVSSKGDDASAADTSSDDTSSDDTSSDDTSSDDTSSDDTSSGDTSNDDTSSGDNVGTDLKAFEKSGTFETVYSKSCRFAVDYTVKSAAQGKAELTLKVILDCYDVSVSARPDMGKITVGDKTYNFSTEKIEHLDGKRHQITLTELKTELERGEKLDINVSVSWAYNGVYSEEKIENMTAGGSISVAKDGTVTAKANQ